MTFEEVRQRLQAQGWHCEERRITSPSGGYCFDHATFDRDIRAVYFPAARRFHSFGQRGAGELGVLVKVLEEHPVVEPLCRYLTLVRLELVSSVARYEMAISTWDFGYPSVRATGRHPTSGVAVIECVVDEPCACDVWAYHSIDDAQSLTRRSRSQSYPSVGTAELGEILAAAVAYARSSPAPSAFVTERLIDPGQSR